MFKTLSFPKASLFAGACLTLLAAAPALAAPALPQVAVTYADLNLSTQKSQRILSARIENAARAVCAPEADLLGVQSSLNFAKCVRESAQRATAAIPEPEIRTALQTMLTNRAGT